MTRADIQSTRTQGTNTGAQATGNDKRAVGKTAAFRADALSVVTTMVIFDPDSKYGEQNGVRDWGLALTTTDWGK